MQVLDSELGIERAHIETIHAYTSDQNLLDNFHRKPRRGRSAPLNMVVTSTGAAKAVVKVIPSLEGKLTGNAVRVPVPNGSLVIMNITTSRKVNRDEVNEIVRKASLNGPLCEQIRYSDSQEYVSSSIVGEDSTCVFDAPSTRVSTDGYGLSVYAWYDNEFGYSCQVMRLAKYMAGVHRKRFI
jgi:glyceraldehyde 3-phosphate dehydrogenase